MIVKQVVINQRLPVLTWILCGYIEERYSKISTTVDAGSKPCIALEKICGLLEAFAGRSKSNKY